jgi:hypothetical protein
MSNPYLNRMHRLITAVHEVDELLEGPAVSPP